MFCARQQFLIALVATFGLIGQIANACTAPERPFLPERSEDVREYADLLRSDFEGYIADIQEYFRCLDAVRQRAFQEAREVSEDYGKLVELLE